MVSGYRLCYQTNVCFAERGDDLSLGHIFCGSKKATDFQTVVIFTSLDRVFPLFVHRWNRGNVLLSPCGRQRENRRGRNRYYIYRLIQHIFEYSMQWLRKQMAL